MNVTFVIEILRNKKTKAIFFFSPSIFFSLSSYRHSFISTPIQEHIDHLYEQINELALELTEERFKHKQTRFKVNLDTIIIFTKENILE